ncbi:MAG: glycoside hydrolase N-terminal domain-containing protein [Oscillospiraceae bacterium]|nr:glycoside hydrolase N-terminal domain-containing protein [Oscillospiraceae bacterium]
MKNKLFIQALGITLTAALLLCQPISGGFMGTAAAPGSGSDLLIWHDTPAKVPIDVKDLYTWAAEASPIGNGRLGAMVYGGVGNETLLINEATIWSGGPGASQYYKGGNKGLPATNKMQLNLLRQRLQDTGDGAMSWDTESALRNYLAGDASTFGAYQELGLLRISDNPLSELANMLKNIQTNTSAPGSNYQSVEKLFDGTNSSKWCYPKVPSVADPIWISWEYGGSVTADSYRIVTAEDVVARDPKSWKLMASNTSGGPYTVLDEQTDYALPDTRNALVNFTVANPMPYKYYRLEIYAIKGGDSMTQMAQFLPLGDFNRNTAKPPETPYTDYSRSLDLRNGIVTVKYTSNGTRYIREYFVSAPDNVLAVRISADKPGAVSSYIGIESRRQNGDAGVSGDTITLIGQPDDQRTDGLHFISQVKVIPEGGSLSNASPTLRLQNADAVTILMTVGTNYRPCYDDTYDYFSDRETSFTAVRTRTAAAAGKGYTALRAAHVTDYSALFNKISLTSDGIAMPAKTTAALVNGYGSGNNANEDRYLELLYYQFARYLLISSSRGEEPSSRGEEPSSRGNEMSAASRSLWSWGMTQLNQGSHADGIIAAGKLAQSGNLLDCQQPVMSYIRSLAVNGRTTAAHYHAKPDGTNVRGWTAYGATNLWGYTAPGGYTPGFYTPDSGAKLALAVWEYYQNKPNKAFLEQNYELLLDAALFWVDNLWADADSGKLIVNPAVRSQPYGSGDHAVIKRLFKAVTDAAAVLGKSGDATVAAIRAADEKLSKTDARAGKTWAETLAGSSGNLLSVSNGLSVYDNYAAGAAMYNQLFALPGDVNGDGYVRIDDARMLLQHLVGKIMLTPEQLDRAAVQESGKITVSDARLILQKLVGKINKFPIEG